MEQFNEPKTLELENVGMHNIDVDITVLAIDKYISVSGLPVFLAFISSKEATRVNKELCGISDCTCGSSLNLAPVDCTEGMEALCINEEQYDSIIDATDN